METQVLDPCCGSRMMWFQRDTPLVVFGDIRQETHSYNDKSTKSGVRELIVNPDVRMDFRNIPFPDESFNLIAFDPPHLVRAGKKSWLALKYGVLGSDWKSDIQKGFSECFRVLKNGGTLVFKWNETQVKLKDVLALTEHKPLFGHRTGKNGNTFFLVFFKSI